MARLRRQRRRIIPYKRMLGEIARMPVEIPPLFSTPFGYYTWKELEESARATMYLYDRRPKEIRDMEKEEDIF